MSLTMMRRRSLLDLRQLLPMALLSVAVMLSSLLPALAPQPLALPAAPAITSASAIDLAITPAGVDERALDRLELFSADFQPAGITFQPRFGGAPWSWSLAEISAGGAPLAGVSTGAVVPAMGDGQADYNRGAIIERYLTRSNAAIEQQFVIPAPLTLGGQDLTIRGTISSLGAFSAIERGWEWRTDEGFVTLGDVFVFDANGVSLPATMQVTAASSMITVDGAALAGAAYPVTIDPLIGTNDFAVTNISGQAGNLYDAMEPGVAYNPVTDQYLVVFAADGPVDSASPRLNEEFEIYGQFVNGTTGALAGPAFRISRNGNDLPTDFADTISPDVAYSARDNLFLVTWAADNANPTGSGYNSANGFEIYVQVVSASGELLIEGDDRISSILAFTFRADLTDDGIVNEVTPDWDAYTPSVAYNSSNGDFLVCWSDDRGTAIPTTAQGLLGGRFQIRCKRFIMDPPADNSRPFFGSEPPNQPYTISSMRPTSGASAINADAYTPDVVYNSVDDQWLVVWSGDDINGNQLDDEFEIFGQILSADGTQVGADSRFTRLGGETGAAIPAVTCASAACDAYYPTVAHNPDRNQYLVAYTGDTVDGSEEVYYTLRTNTGTVQTFALQQGQLSQMGGAGTSGAAANLKGLEPDVAYDALRKEWMVIWRGDNTTNEVFQIYGQRLDATTPTDAELGNPNSLILITEVGDTDFLIGSTRTIVPNSVNNQGLNNKFLLSGGQNGDGSVVFDGQPLATRLNLAPALATNGRGGYMAVWTGNSTANNTGQLTEVRLDIRGRLMDYNAAPVVTAPANVTAEASGPSGAVATYSDASASDEEDGALTATCLPASGDTFALGDTTVTCTATDSTGKQGTATFTVTVQDTTRPVITSPGDQSAEATGPAGAAVSFAASSFDLVDADVPVTCAPVSGSTFGLGDTTVTCNASDDAGNAADPITFMVSVQDTTAPTLTLPSPITVASLTGSAVVSFEATATDSVDTEVPVTCDPASGSSFAYGTTTVACSASDDSGNSATGSFTVTVQDANAPVLSLPSPITTEATSAAGAVVTYSASATDTKDGNVAASCAPASGSTFPLGSTTVDCTSTDSDNNTTNGSFTVTVQDTTAPTIDVPASGISVRADDETGKVVTFSVTASDTVDSSVTPVCAPASGTKFAVGTTTVTCTASDDAGNEGSASFTVTVASAEAQADLGLARSLTPSPVTAGTDLTASFTVSNAGPDAATGVQLSVPVPSSLTFKSGTSGCALDGSTVKCAVGSIANGASKTVELVFAVKFNASGNITLNATVSAAETDPSGGNNTGGGSVPVTPSQAPNRIYLPILAR